MYELHEKSCPDHHLLVSVRWGSADEEPSVQLRILWQACRAVKNTVRLPRLCGPTSWQPKGTTPRSIHPQSASLGPERGKDEQAVTGKGLEGSPCSRCCWRPMQIGSGSSSAASERDTKMCQLRKLVDLWDKGGGRRKNFRWSGKAVWGPSPPAAPDLSLNV